MSEGQHTGTTDDGAGRTTLVARGGDALLDRAAMNGGDCPVTPESGVVWVTTDGADDVIDQVRGAGVMPASVDVVSLGESVRSATAGANDPCSTSVPFRPTDLTVHAVGDSARLDDVGTTIVDCLEAIDAAGRDAVLVVEDLDALLDASGPEATFRFLHVLVGRVGASDGSAVVGYDPDATAVDVASTFAVLFDELRQAQ
ncbi:MAG: hypothetical protein ABEJ42_03655 [Halobacteriaceae archaeon]